MITPADIYSLRTTNLLDVPEQVMDMITSMQLAPVAQMFFKKIGFKKGNDRGHRGVPTDKTSWRNDVVISMKRSEFKDGDVDYETIVGISNKVAASTLSTSVSTIIEILKKRSDDNVFRLRVVSFLFDRGVSMPFFSKLIANMFELINVQIPEIREDLQFSCSIDSFTKMFDQTTIVTHPDFADPEYEEKLCLWSKRKEIRRGFGMFVTELHIRGLVDEDIIVGAIKMAIDEVNEIIQKPAEKALIETVDQLITLLFETCKIINTRYGKDHPTVILLKEYSRKITALSKTETPCMNMRSRFKLEDVQKL